MNYSNFQNGNIITLRLQNFQTFKNACINFSPSLNFIIGPNGSGKSTIGNAISLIFGGTPKTIGKAKNIKEYIRFNEHSCKIEADIFYEGQIIKLGRGFNIANNYWFINEKLVKKTEYEECINKLNININNLCQYLPQEKVSEFCRMSSEELLINTLMSLNKNELIRELEYIANVENKMFEIGNKEELLEKQKKEVSNLLNNINKDMEKIKEKDEKMKNLEMLESKRDYLEYDKIVKEYKRIDNSIKILEKNYEDNKKEIEDINVQIENIENNPRNRDLRDEIVKLKEFDMNLKKNIEDIKCLENENILLDIDLEHISKVKEKRQEDINNLRKEIQNNKEDLERIKERILEDKEYIHYEGDEEIYGNMKNEGFENIKRNKNFSDDNKNVSNSNELDFICYTTNLDSLFVKYDSTRIHEKEDEIYSLKKKKIEIQRICGEIKRKVDELEEKKRKIDQISERRLELLKKYSHDTYKAVMWLRANTDVKFKDEIIEPPFLNINITNEEYMQEVEIFLNYNILTSFICKNSEDFELFGKLMKDEMKLAINIVEDIKTVNKSRYTEKEIKDMGFDGVIIDFISARSEIINFLIASSHLNEIPVTKKNLNEKQIFESTSFKRMAINNKYIEIRRSKYNKEDYVISSNVIKSKSLFSYKEDMNEIINQLSEFNKQRSKYNEELKVIYGKIEILENEIKKMYDQRKEYEYKISEIKTRIDLYKITLDNIRNKNLQIKKIENSEIDLEKENMEEIKIKKKKKFIKEKISQVNDQIIKILKDEKYLGLLKNAVLIYREIKKEFSKLQLLMNSKNNIERQNTIVISTIEEHERLKSSLKDKLSEKKELLRNKKYDKEEMVKLPDNIEELTGKIKTLKAQLKFINVNEDIRNEYEAKKEELDALEKEIEENKKNKVVFEEDVFSRKKTLISEIKEITDKLNIEFNLLFKKLKCDGKILFEYENMKIKNWKISILVKFREIEKLEKLSSYRQSGGEKSVSTILFLLALQKIDKAPFRLVDEINQGMDKYNEKSILEILFNMCEIEKKTQFFIISPKLVEGLKYSKSMKVIVLFSDQSEELKRLFVEN